MIGRVLCGLAAIVSAAAVQAQAPAGLPPIDAVPPVRIEQIVLSPGDAKAEQWVSVFGQAWVTNVQQPGLYPVRPLNGRGNGKAVIVVPGGGYKFVSISSEGFLVAERLAAQGYTAFVLKYRVLPSPRDPRAFMAEGMKSFGSLGKAELPDHPPAVDDLASAIDYVRGHVKDYAIDPAQIGVIGFSAGSRTAIRLIENKPGQAAALRHVALVYPPMTQVVKGGPRPSLFLAIAADDPLFRQGGLTLLDRWLGESRTVEFHLYSGGGHGFGMMAHGTTSDGWLDDYLRWLALQ